MTANSVTDKAPFNIEQKYNGPNHLINLVLLEIYYTIIVKYKIEIQ